MNPSRRIPTTDINPDINATTTTTGRLVGQVVPWGHAGLAKRRPAGGPTEETTAPTMPEPPAPSATPRMTNTTKNRNTAHTL